MRATTAAKRGAVALFGVLVAVAIVAFVASMVTILVVNLIWPGEAKLTAPLLCPDDKPDAFVVSDISNVQPGETSINYTLYCMGPRGEIENVGYLRPFAILAFAHAVIVAPVVIGLITMVRRVVRRATRTAPDLAHLGGGDTDL